MPQNQGFLKRGWVDAKKVAAIDQEVDAQDAATLAEYAKHGITPIKIGNLNTWHGLTDEGAAELVGCGEWYDLYYRPFSEESHASEPAIRSELEQLMAEGKVTLGPQFHDPYPVLRALVDAVAGALLSLDRQFGIGKEGQIRAIATPLVTALAKHQTELDPVAFRRLFT